MQSLGGLAQCRVWSIGSRWGRNLPVFLSTRSLIHRTLTGCLDVVSIV